jgi:hypothetical protein
MDNGAVEGCPVCGSDQRSPLAPGLWRCDGIAVDRWVETAFAPAPGGPPGAMVPVPVPRSRQRVCANEYYEAAATAGGGMQFCAICDSNGAIGRCADDRRMVCGYCSEMTGGRRLCKECLAKIAADAAAVRLRAAAAEAQAKEAAAQAKLDAVRAQLAQAAAVLSALGDVKDEADRLLVLVLLSDQLRRHFTSFDGAVTNAIYEELRLALVSAARRAIAPKSPMGDVSSDFPAGWTCDPVAILDHFRRSGRLRSDTLTTVHTTSPKGKKQRARGWNAGRASKGRDSVDVYVLTDGTVVGGPGGNTLTLSHIYMLMKAGQVTLPTLPPSASIADLTGITIPWA